MEREGYLVYLREVPDKLSEAKRRKLVGKRARSPDRRMWRRRPRRKVRKRRRHEGGARRTLYASSLFDQLYA